MDKLTVLRAGDDYFTEKVKRTGTIHTDTKGHLWRHRVLFIERLFTERLFTERLFTELATETKTYLVALALAQRESTSTHTSHIYTHTL